MVPFKHIDAPYTGSGELIELPPLMRGVPIVRPARVVEDRSFKIKVIPGKWSADASEFAKEAKVL